MNRTYMVDILALFLGYQVTVDMMQQFLHVICLNFIGLQIKRGKQFMFYDYAMIRDDDVSINDHQVLYEKMIKHSLSDCIYLCVYSSTVLSYIILARYVRIKLALFTHNVSSIFHFVKLL